MFELSSASIAFGMLVVGFFGAVFGVFKYFGSEIDKVITKASVTEEKLTERIESVRRETTLACEKQAEAESKRRHDLANQMQMAVNDIRRDQKEQMKELNDRVDRISREAVRKEDMREVEVRMVGAINEVKQSATSGMNELKQMITQLMNPSARPVHNREGT